MKNLYLLPTDKPSRLCLDRNGNLLFAPNSGFTVSDGKVNIFITSDEVIKEWYIYQGRLLRASVNHSKYEILYGKPIILTTDPDLIKDGVQAIDDEFIEWFVKNPSCEKVEVVTDLNTQGKNGLDRARFIYKIILPKSETYICPKTNKQCDDECCVSAENCNIGTGVLSEPKQETLEEAAKNSDKSKCKHFRREHTKIEVYDSFEEGFIAGAKWQQERDYELIDRYVDDVMGGCNLKFKEWVNR